MGDNPRPSSHRSSFDSPVIFVVVFKVGICKAIKSINFAVTPISRGIDQIPSILFRQPLLDADPLAHAVNPPRSRSGQIATAMPPLTRPW